LKVRESELSYVDRGEGLPLLLVHGFPLDHTMWDGQIDRLSRRTGEMLVGEAFLPAQGNLQTPSPRSNRVIAPDLRGFGRSRALDAPVADGPAADDKVTMEQFADDLAGLLDGLGITEPVVLCGLSMGGYIAFQFWRKYANRLRGLILCDTRATADTTEVAAGRRSMAERVLREGPAPLVENMMPRLFAASTQSRQPPMLEGLRRVMMANDPRGIAAAARGMAERPEMTPLLAAIDCPTLLLVGQYDAIATPAEMRDMADAIPRSTFVEIPDAGHMAPMENAAAVNTAILAFLATL
jgi:pimeloyl-ACP methyl ester carboxylesterase